MAKFFLPRLRGAACPDGLSPVPRSPPFRRQRGRPESDEPRRETAHRKSRTLAPRKLDWELLWYLWQCPFFRQPSIVIGFYAPYPVREPGQATSLPSSHAAVRAEL